MATETEDFTPYSVGLCYASVCTNIDDVEEIARRLNTSHPTGVAPWVYHGKSFNSGEPNPCPCETLSSTHKHYLFSC